MNYDIIENPDVAAVFARYPEDMREKLMALRQLVLEMAQENEDAGPLEETLKWGEPSYITKHGSAVRMDWKPDCPDEYAMYFHCQTKLVDTFREIYRNTFRFEGSRAIVFNKDDVIPVEELKHCVSLAMRYHKIKHLPMLGL